MSEANAGRRWLHHRTLLGSAAEFAEMATAVHAGGTIEETVDRILSFAVTALQCAYAGVILHRRNGLVTLAATDPVVADLDALQLEFGQGPDIDLIADRTGVLVTDVTTDTRWPDWARRVEKAGVRSMLGARLQTADRIVGTLNFYDPAPDHFSPDDQAVAGILASHAATALAKANEVAHLQVAIDGRNRIGQAQGILMERYDLDEDQAFQVLLRYSQDNNIKLRAVAERVVTTRALPDGEDVELAVLDEEIGETIEEGETAG